MSAIVTSRSLVFFRALIIFRMSSEVTYSRAIALRWLVILLAVRRYVSPGPFLPGPGSAACAW